MGKRHVLDSLWNRNNLIGVNGNFEYLFDGVDNTKNEIINLTNDYQHSKIDTENKMSYLYDNIGEVKTLSQKATSALNEAQELKEQNNKANERIDNIIASSGTSSTEVVDARGTYKVLSERLSETDKRNDYEKKKNNEKNFLDFLFENSAQLSNNTIEINKDRDLTLAINLSTRDQFVLNFAKNINDDFIKFREVNYVGEVASSDAQTVTDNFNQSMVKSGSIPGSGDNWYATEIGTKIEYNFTGSSITFRYWTDTRGGIWKASIDGNFVKNISTNSGDNDGTNVLGGGVMETNIASNLENKEHTLVLEFTGQDDNYPTTTPRGWVRTVSESSNTKYAFDTFVYVVKGASVTKTQNALFDSNKEFAFRVDFGDRAEWIPEHNSVGTLKLSDKGSQRLLVDNKEINMTQVMSKTPFTEVKILQNLFGLHPTTNEKYCEFIIITTITSRGVKFNTKVKWLKETIISSGYVNMFTVNPQFMTDIITSYNTKYSTQIFDNSYEYLQDEAPYSYIATSSFYNDLYLICHNVNPYETLRMNYDDREGDTYGKGLFALQHRNQDLQKLYPKTYKNHKTKVNEVYQFEGFFGFGKLPMVNKLF
ncbi:hypothetical protein [Staphylococcus hominis]|uniref:hypothetical protein n=1 Tax=Staphylococcus hominis TaxID=1290 RepID=UPI00066BE7D7|nr:hypothetical protein [Staphylococcus hominis]